MKTYRQKLHIKQGDIVVAIAGEDGQAKKAGKVLRVYPTKGTAIVEGLNLVKKTIRKSQDHPQGGIIEKEAPIAVSNLRLENQKEARPAKKQNATSNG